jgi:hypothetical protein
MGPGRPVPPLGDNYARTTPFNLKACYFMLIAWATSRNCAAAELAQAGER